MRSWPHFYESEGRLAETVDMVPGGVLLEMVGENRRVNQWK